MEQIIVLIYLTKIFIHLLKKMEIIKILYILKN